MAVRIHRASSLVVQVPTGEASTEVDEDPNALCNGVDQIVGQWPVLTGQLANAALLLSQVEPKAQAQVANFLEAISNDSGAPVVVQSSEESEAYTILDALEDFSNGKTYGKELWLKSKNGLATYKVLSFNPKDHRCSLESPHGAKLKPVIGQREVPLYYATWT